jgi:hypothetical protein
MPWVLATETVAVSVQGALQIVPGAHRGGPLAAHSEPSSQRAYRAGLVLRQRRLVRFYKAHKLYPSVGRRGNCWDKRSLSFGHRDS